MVSEESPFCMRTTVGQIRPGPALRGAPMGLFLLAERAVACISSYARLLMQHLRGCKAHADLAHMAATDVATRDCGCFKRMLERPERHPRRLC